MFLYVWRPMSIFLSLLNTIHNCGEQNISNVFNLKLLNLLYHFCQIQRRLDKHCSPHFPVLLSAQVEEPFVDMSFVVIIDKDLCSLFSSIRDWFIKIWWRWNVAVGKHLCRDFQFSWTVLFIVFCSLPALWCFPFPSVFWGSVISVAFQASYQRRLLHQAWGEAWAKVSLNGECVHCSK